MRVAFSIFILFLLSFSAVAQNTRYRPYFTFGFGGTSYRGDLTNCYESWGGTFNAGIVLNKKKRMNGYLHLMIGGVRGENPTYVYKNDPSATPNQYFKTALFSVGYELRINIIKKDFFNLYLSPGIGILRYNPKDQYNESYADQFSTRAKNETYSNVSVILPIKIGSSYFLESGYGIGIDAGFLNPMTDHIDNISQWGNRSKKDNLLQINLMLYVPLKKRELDNKLKAKG
ncbi:MAG: outer membrane beta-barrel protein [Cytophagales bacterium]|nr:outer membrane beta-barrel protein [Cytophaga sp.]